MMKFKRHQRRMMHQQKRVKAHKKIKLKKMLQILRSQEATWKTRFQKPHLILKASLSRPLIQVRTIQLTIKKVSLRLKKLKQLQQIQVQKKTKILILLISLNRPHQKSRMKQQSLLKIIQRSSTQPKVPTIKAWMSQRSNLKVLIHLKMTLRKHRIVRKMLTRLKKLYNHPKKILHNLMKVKSRMTKILATFR